jgi:group I intron endonuclease
MNACIYKITSANGKQYVGSTVKGFEWRKKKHLNELRKNKHHNRHLQNAFGKYGENSFVFEVLEIVYDVSILTKKEQEWIETLHPEYNVLRDIKSHIGVKRSKETCKKISDANKGKSHSEATKKKLRDCNLGKKQSSQTIELKRLKNFKGILQLDMNEKIIKEWQSATHAEQNLGYKRKYIYRCLQGIRPNYKGFKWQLK